MPSKRKRWFRFSLKAMLIAIAVVSVLLAFVAWWKQPYEVRWYDKNGTVRVSYWKRRSVWGDEQLVLDRPTTYFYPNGQKIYGSQFQDDEVWKWWSPNGEEITQDEFDSRYSTLGFTDLFDLTTEPPKEDH